MNAVAGRHSRKDLLDDEIVSAQDRIVEECGHCGVAPEVIELLGKPLLGIMALRLRCPTCSRSWGIGMGDNSFWREED